MYPCQLVVNLVPRSTGPGLPQSGALLGLVEGLRREETVGVGWPRKELVRTPMGSEPDTSFLIKFS